jgi:arginine repressor-like DNA binding protein
LYLRIVRTRSEDESRRIGAGNDGDRHRLTVSNDGGLHFCEEYLRRSLGVGVIVLWCGTVRERVGLRERSALVGVSATTNHGYASSLHQVISEIVTRIQISSNIIVLLVPRGSATLVSDAIDGASWTEIAGTIGGRDTVLLVLNSPEYAGIITERLEGLRSRRVLAIPQLTG